MYHSDPGAGCLRLEITHIHSSFEWTWLFANKVTDCHFKITLVPKEMHCFLIGPFFLMPVVVILGFSSVVMKSKERGGFS